MYFLMLVNNKFINNIHTHPTTFFEKCITVQMCTVVQLVARFIGRRGSQKI